MKKLILSFVLLLVLISPAFADHYYCMIFSYDSNPISLPCKCHVWGKFVQISDNGKLVKDVSISWEPDKISYIDLPRPGWNSTDSLDFAVKTNRSIRMWGPFETNSQFFDKAVVAHDEQGKYKFIDGFSRKSTQNCIHRLSDLAGPHKTGIYWGWWAADSVYKHYQHQGVIHSTKEGEAVIRLLGVDKYPIKKMT